MPIFDRINTYSFYLNVQYRRTLNKLRHEGMKNLFTEQYIECCGYWKTSFRFVNDHPFILFTINRLNETKDGVNIVNNRNNFNVLKRLQLQSDDGPLNFLLTGAVVHKGSEATIGQYVCRVEQLPESRWYLIDDARVTKTSELEIRRLLMIRHPSYCTKIYRTSHCTRHKKPEFLQSNAIVFALSFFVLCKVTRN